MNHIMSNNNNTVSNDSNKKLYFKQSTTEALHTAILLKARNPPSNQTQNNNPPKTNEPTNKILLLNSKWTNQNNLMQISSNSTLVMPPVINLSDDSQSNDSINLTNFNYSDELDSPFKIKENILSSIRNLKPALAGLSSSTSDEDDDESNDQTEQIQQQSSNDIIVIGSQILPNVNTTSNGIVKLTIPTPQQTGTSVQRHSYLRTNTCYAKLNTATNNTPKLPSAFNEMKLCFNNTNSPTTQLTTVTPPIIFNKTATSTSSLLLTKTQLNKVISSKRGKEEALSNSSSSDEETDLQQRVNSNGNQKLQLILNNTNSLKTFMNNNNNNNKSNLLQVTAHPHITPVVSAAAAAAAAAAANSVTQSTSSFTDSDLINSPSSMSSNKSDSDYGSLINSNLSFSVSSPTSCCSSSNSSSCTTNDSSSAIDLNDDNSSTASGPIYVRQPGFEFHAHEVQVPDTNEQKTVKPLGRANKKTVNEKTNTKIVTKAKKKLCMMINTDLSPITASIKDDRQNIQLKPISNKAKREPLPMRLRALPPSFWQQPNQPNATLSTMYLPPLFKNEIIENVLDETDDSLSYIEDFNNNFTNNNKIGMFDSIQNYREVKISPANTDLLFKLFDNIEQRQDNKKLQLQLQYKSNR